MAKCPECDDKGYIIDSMSSYTCSCQRAAVPVDVRRDAEFILGFGVKSESTLRHAGERLARYIASIAEPAAPAEPAPHIPIFGVDAAGKPTPIEPLEATYEGEETPCTPTTNPN